MSFKDSGIEWIGQIPSHWHTLSVSKAYDITLGKMLQPNLNNSNDFKVPYLKAMNVQDGYVNLEKIEEMYCSTNELNSFKLECGDLVVCEGGEVARSAIIKENLAGFIFQNSVHRVKGTAKGDTRFLHYLLVALRASGFINILVNKATIAHFTKDKFNSLKIALPPLDEQLIVSDYLDDKYDEIENLIKTKQKLITLLEQQRQSIITEAVTKGLNPNVKMKDSGVEWIGEIPENWEVTKIIYYAKLLTGGTPNKDNPAYWEDGNINWMASGEVNKEFVYEVNSKITKMGMQNSAAKILPKHSIMIALNGQGKTKGKVAVLEVETTCNQSLAAFICNKEKLHHLYLYYYLKSKYKELRGLVGDGLRDGISLGLLKSIKIPLPSLSEQKEISRYLFEYDKKVTDLLQELGESIELLKEYRQSLIYETVTGKIDVRDMELD